MKHKLFKYIISLTFILAFVITVEAHQGEKIFRQNCATCHTIGKGKLTGPDLKNINSKHSEEWLVKWTKSSLSLVRSGDSAAVAIFNEFNNTPMTDFTFLTDHDIKSIFNYIRTESENPTEKTSISISEQTSTHDKSMQQTRSRANDENTIKDFVLINPDTFFNYLWIGLIAIFFLIIILVLKYAIFTLSEALKEEHRKTKFATTPQQISQK